MKESVPTENHNKLFTACTEDAITDRKKKANLSHLVQSSSRYQQTFFSERKCQIPCYQLY